MEHLGNGSGQRRLTVVNMTNGTNVHVGLGTNVLATRLSGVRTHGAQ